MKRLSVIAAVMFALASPASAAPVSSVGSSATLSPTGETWRLNAETVRASRLRTRSRSIFRARNQDRGIRNQDPRTPIYSISEMAGLGQIFGGGSRRSFFADGPPGQNRVFVVSVNPQGGVVGGINITDVFSGGGSSPTVPVVPIPASLPLLLGGIGLLAFMRRRA